jgi:hypothetical protein
MWMVPPMPPRLTQAALMVGSSLITVLGVTMLGWNLQTVVLLYWIENLIIGGCQLVKLLTVRRAGAPAAAMLLNLPLAAFFTVHYGMFCLVHGVFIFALTGGSRSGQAGAFLEGGLVSGVREAFPASTVLVVVVMVASRGVETWRKFFLSGRWLEGQADQLMAEPYKHIVVVHLAILGGAFLIIGAGSPLPLLLLMIVGKLLIDLREVRSEAVAGV